MRAPAAAAPWIGDLGTKVQAHRPVARKGVTLDQILALIRVDGALNIGGFVLRLDALLQAPYRRVLHTLVRFCPFAAGCQYGVRWSS